MNFSNIILKSFLLISVLSVITVNCGGGGMFKKMFKKGGIMMLGHRLLPMPLPMPIPIPMIHDNHHHHCGHKKKKSHDEGDSNSQSVEMAEMPNEISGLSSSSNLPDLSGLPGLSDLSGLPGLSASPSLPGLTSLRDISLNAWLN